MTSSRVGHEQVGDGVVNWKQGQEVPLTIYRVTAQDIEVMREKSYEIERIIYETGKNKYTYTTFLNRLRHGTTP